MEKRNLVILADDNKDVTESVALFMNGYMVLQTSTVKRTIEAIDWFENDLVGIISDFDFGEEENTGWNVYEYFRTKCDNRPFIFFTGSNLTDFSILTEDTNCKVLHKLTPMAQLRECFDKMASGVLGSAS